MRTTAIHGPSSNQQIGRLNLVAAFECIRVHQPVSRAELHRLLRLSKPTVSRVVDELEMLALVRPTLAPEDRPSTGPGRNGVLYELVPGLPGAVGIDIDLDDPGQPVIRAARSDVTGEVQARAEARLRNGSSGEILLAVREAQRRIGARPTDQVVVGIDDFGAHVAADLGPRVIVDSRTHLAALAHVSHAASYLYVAVRPEGEELALVLDGELRRGGRPTAPVCTEDLGHRVVTLAVPVIRATDIDVVVVSGASARDLDAIRDGLASEVAPIPRVTAASSGPLAGALALGVRTVVADSVRALMQPR